jgi:plastocyanin
MSLRSPLAVITLGMLPFVAACGGGSKPTPSAAPTGAPAAPAAGGSGSISGKVTFDGTPPAPEKVKTSADPNCAKLHPTGLEKKVVDVSGGGLANAFVWVKSGVSGSHPAPAEPVLLDQQGCMYHPHIIVVQAGQPIKIRNSDDTLHNIHPRPTINSEFNVGQARKGMESTRTFEKEEIMIPVGCDVHPWMRSYISVVGHPFFAVTKDDGTYEIKGLPAGDYEVEVRHEKAAPATLKVTVKANESAKADFAVKG